MQIKDPDLMTSAYIATIVDILVLKDFIYILDNLGGATPEDKALALTRAALLIDDLPRYKLSKLERVTIEMNISQLILFMLTANPPILTNHLQYQLGLALGKIGKHRFHHNTLHGTNFILPKLTFIPSNMNQTIVTKRSQIKIEHLESGIESSTGWTNQAFIPAFSIGKYPVTNAEYSLFLEQDGYNEKKILER